jgi:hypothetical protein
MSVIFDQLRLSDDGKRILINAHVNKARYFDGIYIKNITITSADRVSETNPHVPTKNYLYRRDFESGTKSIDLVLTANDLMRNWEKEISKMVFKETDMSGTLFFVYIECAGTPSIDTPCRLDEMLTVGVTFDEKLLYQRTMDYVKRLSDDCNVPIGFIDFILLWNAFKASIETDHFIPAIRFWNMLFGDWNKGNTSKGCGCHG